MLNKQDFISFMQEAGVLVFGDFVTKSGRKTPYFVNTGNYRTGRHISVLGDFYADCVAGSGKKYDALFGPAYKGITLVAATASSLYRNHGIDIPFFFNRAVAKNRGEGGVLVGYTPKDGDRIAVIEDVVTAGTTVRETLELFKTIGDVKLESLYISVDRMERGTGMRTALDELSDEYNIDICAIVNVRDIIGSFPKGDERIAKMDEYLKEYGAKLA